MVKKVWSRPQLIVLVRGRSEEFVLTACKASSGSNGTGKTNCGQVPCNAASPS